MRKILVTGFGPFGNKQRNPSFEAVRLLPDEVSGFQIVKYELPVEYRTAGEQLVSLLKEQTPDAVLCVGLASGRKAVTPEFRAVNRRGSLCRDNAGVLIGSEEIEEGGSDERISSFNIDAAVSLLRKNGIPAEKSFSAGTFICNEVFYTALSFAGKEGKDLPVGFLHVPDASEYKPGPSAGFSLPLQTIRKAIELVIESQASCGKRKVYQKAALFDLDGTTARTIEDITDSVNCALNQYGFPTRTTDEVMKMVGNGARNIIARAVGEEHADLVDDMLLVYKEYYANHYIDKTAPYPGILDLLKKLKEDGIGIGLISNKHDSATQQICASLFPGLLDYVTGEVSGIARKPDPVTVKKACEALGAESCVYIGDSETDIVTANNAGVPGIIVTWGYRTRETLVSCGAETLVSTPEDLYTEIRKQLD